MSNPRTHRNFLDIYLLQIECDLTVVGQGLAQMAVRLMGRLLELNYIIGDSHVLSQGDVIVDHLISWWPENQCPLERFRLYDYRRFGDFNNITQLTAPAPWTNPVFLICLAKCHCLRIFLSYAGWDPLDVWSSDGESHGREVLVQHTIGERFEIIEALDSSLYEGHQYDPYPFDGQDHTEVYPDPYDLDSQMEWSKAIEDYERQLCKCTLSGGQSQTHCNFLRIYQLGVYMDELDNSLAVQHFKELNIAISDMACSAVITRFSQWWNVEGSQIEKIRLIDQQNWELDEEEAMEERIITDYLFQELPQLRHLHVAYSELNHESFNGSQFTGHRMTNGIVEYGQCAVDEDIQGHRMDPDELMTWGMPEYECDPDDDYSPAAWPFMQSLDGYFY
ncbi:hypothetical protein BKA93DRAFT_752225 [Sparassis latifolia]